MGKTVMIREELIERLQKIAKVENAEIDEIVEQIVLEYIERHEHEIERER